MSTNFFSSRYISKENGSFTRWLFFLLCLLLFHFRLPVHALSLARSLAARSVCLSFRFVCRFIERYLTIYAIFCRFFTNVCVWFVPFCWAFATGFSPFCTCSKRIHTNIHEIQPIQIWQMQIICLRGCCCRRTNGKNISIKRHGEQRATDSIWFSKKNEWIFFSLVTTKEGRERENHLQ